LDLNETQLGEIGDVERPKLVFIFDEARLLFTDAPKVLPERIKRGAMRRRVAKNAMRAAGSQVGRQVMCGIFESMLGTPATRRRR
jgi:hypothetical protein